MRTIRVIFTPFLSWDLSQPSESLLANLLKSHIITIPNTIANNIMIPKLSILLYIVT